ncbi:MAG: MarR family winged helix-turn-helix transcriptional regulator, partial [Acutalibacteraceae bacterium]
HYHSSEMNDKLILDLRDISHMMRMQYEGKASQKRILIILNECGTLTQKELTERLGVKPGSASEILSKLENAGLITRAQNKEDKRTTDITLTDDGSKLAFEASEQRQNRHEEMFSCLTAEEKMTLLSLLEKIRTDWESNFTNSPVHGHHFCHKEHGGHDGRHHVGKPHHGE